MRLTHLGHACLLLEIGGTRLLVDPGSFSPDAEHVTGVDAVLLTHQHADHVDLARLPGLLSTGSRVRLLAEPETADLLAEHGMDAERLKPGGEHLVGAARVRVVGGWHAVIHLEVPRVGNVGLLVDDAAGGGPLLFHPGDSYDTVPQGVDVLAVPLCAPWCAVKETVEFVRAVRPRVAVPIHDAIVLPEGRALYLGHIRRLAPEGTEVRDLARAGAVDL